MKAEETMHLVLVIDVGGSSLKANACAHLMGDGEFVLEQDLTCDIDSSGDRSSILAAFEKLFFSLLSSVQSKLQANCDISGVALAFPGPADYRQGIPLMQGLAKYEALYGVSIYPDLHRALEAALVKLPVTEGRRIEIAADFHLTMENDARMYAYGMWIANGRPGGIRIAVLTLGTGLGSAFIVDGTLLTDDPVRNEAEGLPADGYIYHLPLEGRTADDCLSTRGLVELAVTHGIHIPDGRSLADLAEAGDGDAVAVFREFGQKLAAFIDAKDGLGSFRPDIVYLGGNLAQGMQWMDLRTKRAVERHVDSCYPLMGAAAYYFALHKA